MVMSLVAKDLYALLPATYRTRDMENGSPLLALIRIISGQTAILEENIQQLYDDEFIETCERWVIPYIGDLVGASPIYEIGAALHGQRAEVANTIGYRRRKGTLLALEQVAADVSGRPAVAVEFFKRLITNESMRHARPRHAACVDLRHGLQLDRMGGAFDTLNRTVEVRRIAPRVRTVADPDTAPLEIALHGGGKFNVPDIGVYLWRWKSNPVENAPAFMVDARRYLFSPLGNDMLLFNQPPPHDSFSRLMGRPDVPQPIGRREFFKAPGDFYGASLLLIADGIPIDLSQICCRNLSDEHGDRWGCTSAGKIAIDPVLGRIQLGADVPVPDDLRVNYCHGVAADIGGGPYNRVNNLPALAAPLVTFFATVGTTGTARVENAVAAWNEQAPGTKGLIVLPDFESFDIDLTGAAAITVPAGSALWIVAAQPGSTSGAASGPASGAASGTPSGSTSGSSSGSSSDTQPIFNSARVTLRGSVEVHGTGQLVVNGVWIAGRVRVTEAADVQLSDCTLVPGRSLTRAGFPVDAGEPSVVAETAGANVSLLRSISGPLWITPGGLTRICSSIVDATSRCGVAYAAPEPGAAGADLHIEDSTVIGKVHVHTMELASNTIFMARRPKHDPWRAAMWCDRRQAGCMRFCFVPADAIVPRRYRCLPPDADSEAALRPQFITLRYGHPSYGLLSGEVPMAVWTGADNGSQMGMYKTTEETEAVRNVQLRAPEFLPFNMEAGVFLVPSRAVLLEGPPAAYGYGLGRQVDLCCDAFGNSPGDSPEDELLYVGIGAHLV
jgi:hypothetical protein